MSKLTGKEIFELDKRYNLHSWSVQGKLEPKVITRSEGIFFYDDKGSKYFDMSSQLVNMNLGHSNKDIKEAIKKQVDEEYCFISPAYANEARAVLAKKLVELAPDNIAKVFFTNAGADANENAIKIARLFTGRNKIFSRYRSYHGSSFGAGNLTGEPRRFALEPGIPGFVKFFDPYIYREKIKFENEEAASEYYLNKLEEQIIYEGADRVAAIHIETVTGSNGVIIPPKGYLSGIRKICDKYGIMMICDEVMSGFYRTGKAFAFENFNVKPDIITFAKGVTCGYIQLGGVMVSKEIAEYFDTHMLSCGLTYSGHPLACAAGIACLDYYTEHNIADNVNKTGRLLGRLLEDIKSTHKCVGDVRYIGLFAMVELVKDKETREPLVPYGRDTEGIMNKIAAMLMARGFATYTHENMIMVAPPLIITEEELKEAMKILDEVLSAADEKFL